RSLRSPGEPRPLQGFEDSAPATLPLPLDFRYAALSARRSRSDVRFQKAVHEAFGGTGGVVGLGVQGDVERQGDGVTQDGAEQLPGADPWIQRAAEKARLLALGDDPDQQTFALQ